MSSLEDLLVVQGHDIVLDQLRHRFETLPEREALNEVDRTRKTLAQFLVEAEAARDAVAAREEELERNIAASESRIHEIDRRMYSGEVSASRDLQAMAGEIDHIKARVSTLEDSALAAMEEREPLDAAVIDLKARDEALVAEAGRLRAAIATTEAEIAAAAKAEHGARTSAAATVSGELLGAYEKLRGRLGGIGIARLEHGTCMGCHMKLPATELDRIKHQPPDAVVHCDQCGRILVRPAE